MLVIFSQEWPTTNSENVPLLITYENIYRPRDGAILTLNFLIVARKAEIYLETCLVKMASSAQLAIERKSTPHIYFQCRSPIGKLQGKLNFMFIYFIIPTLHSVHLDLSRRGLNRFALNCNSHLHF